MGFERGRRAEAALTRTADEDIMTETIGTDTANLSFKDQRKLHRLQAAEFKAKHMDDMPEQEEQLRGPTNKAQIIFPGAHTEIVWTRRRLLDAPTVGIGSAVFLLAGYFVYTFHRRWTAKKPQEEDSMV